MRERWWRWVQWAGGLLVLVFVARYLVRNWAAIRSEPVAWDLAPGWILASLAIILATYALLTESWRRMLAGWGPRLRWLEAARIWVLSPRLPSSHSSSSVGCCFNAIVKYAPICFTVKWWTTCACGVTVTNLPPTPPP